MPSGLDLESIITIAIGVGTALGAAGGAAWWITRKLGSTVSKENPTKSIQDLFEPVERRLDELSQGQAQLKSDLGQGQTRLQNGVDHLSEKVHSIELKQVKLIEQVRYIERRTLGSVRLPDREPEDE